jgi:hypothetical protein
MQSTDLKLIAFLVLLAAASWVCYRASTLPKNHSHALRASGVLAGVLGLALLAASVALPVIGFAMYLFGATPGAIADAYTPLLVVGMACTLSSGAVLILALRGEPKR